MKQVSLRLVPEICQCGSRSYRKGQVQQLVLTNCKLNETKKKKKEKNELHFFYDL